MDGSLVSFDKMVLDFGRLDCVAVILLVVDFSDVILRKDFMETINR
jgi:hypothetical protein